MNDNARKRVALKLTALHPADRRWVLKQLPAIHRRPIVRLIAELKRLGLRDAALIDAALSPSSPEPVESANPHALYKVLDELPPAWTMAALSLQSAVFRKGYLLRFPEARQRVLTRAFDGTLPPALAAHLQQRLKELAAPRAAVSDTTLLAEETKVA